MGTINIGEIYMSKTNEYTTSIGSVALIAAYFMGLVLATGWKFWVALLFFPYSWYIAVRELMIFFSMIGTPL